MPKRWIFYDGPAVMNALADAKATIVSLKTIPHQKQWVESLQEVELKREVAGTSRIEGADFTERELDEAMKLTPEELVTRSQRQAHAAVQTYRWIAEIPDDLPIDGKLICEIHRRIVTGADDEFCPPGIIRSQDQNVSFGAPRHRGAEGGAQVDDAFKQFVHVIQKEFRDHDPIVQAIAAHYHLAAMHPYLDGNGRTARALEALMLQRAGLRDTAFIAMSNYYYDEKPGYLKALADTQAAGHDLTSFLNFALRGVSVQSGRLLAEIRREMQKELFLNMAYKFFNRLSSRRRRVLGERQIKILKILLDSGPLRWSDIRVRSAIEYAGLKNPTEAAARDVINLMELGALTLRQEKDHSALEVHLDWPSEITETEFFDRVENLPRGKTTSFLR